MAKKFWKLQSFPAHEANVICVSLGHKSGRVLATGGDDKKVNLWAIGKENCIMSLSGHSTSIETVRFSHSEELIGAGSSLGVLKIWDLEAAKIVKNLTGHKSGITTLDFHPYGDFLSSGSYDSMIKLWDIRKKGCIATMKAHKGRVNALRFSPDGQWIASCGEDALVKLWDLRAGRILHEFDNHISPVTSVEFHPNEFLLVSGGCDRTVNFFDLENFTLVSAEADVGNVKCLFFNPDGACIFSGLTEGLKILGWEPSRVFDSVPVPWGKVSDVATAHNQLIGASFLQTHVTIHIVDLNNLKPFSGVSYSSSAELTGFHYGHSVRKSFTKFSNELLPSARESCILDDYKNLFQPSRTLTRTPPPPAAPFEDPERDIGTSQPQIITEIIGTNDEDDDEDDESYAEISSETVSYAEPQELPVSDVTHHLQKRIVDQFPPKTQQKFLDTTFTIQSLTIEDSPINRYKILRSPNDNRSFNSDSEVQPVKSDGKRTSDFPVSKPDQSIKKRDYEKCDFIVQKKPDPTDQTQKSICKRQPDRGLDKTLNRSSKEQRKGSFSRSQSDLEQIFDKFSKRNPAKSDSDCKNNIIRQFTSRDIPDRDCNSSTIRHSASEANLTGKRKNVIAKSDSISSSRLPNPMEDFGRRNIGSIHSSIPNPSTTDRLEEMARRITDCNGNNNYNTRTQLSYESVTPGLEANEYFQPPARPVPRPYASVRQLLAEPEELTSPPRAPDEESALKYISAGHLSTMSLLAQRARALRTAGRQLAAAPPTTAAARAALARVLEQADAVLANDLLNILMHRSTFWSLDMFVTVLPTAKKLLQSRVQTHIQTGLDCLNLGLTHFSHLLTTLSPSLADSRDISRTERIQKCEHCKEQLRLIRDILLNLRNKLLATAYPSTYPNTYPSTYPNTYLTQRQTRPDDPELKQFLEKVYEKVKNVVGEAHHWAEDEDGGHPDGPTDLTTAGRSPERS